MKTNKPSAIFSRALLPAVMTVISLIFFTAANRAVALNTVKPYYLERVLLGLPVIVFGIITLLTATELMEEPVSSLITVTITFPMVFVMLFSLGAVVVDSAVTGTSDVGNYERVLKATRYPENPLTGFFPKKIPENARNVEFNYNPAFIQGGENFTLKFETDGDSIRRYTDEFSQRARWVGKQGGSGAEKYGIFIGELDSYTGQPDDFTIYLIDSKPYRPNDWNHGKRSLVAVSRKKNEILFLADDW